MNIIIVCYIYPPEVAPAGQMVMELSEDLASAGHTVTVITGYPNHPQGTLHEGWEMHGRRWGEGRGFRVLRVPHSTSPDRGFRARSRFYATFALNSLTAGLGLGKIDAVLCLSSPVIGALCCWVLSVVKGARFYYDIWDIYPEVALSTGVLRPGPVADLLLRLDTFLCRRAAKVITIAKGMSRTLLARGLKDEHVALVPVWLDTNEITPRDRDNPWRREHCIPESTFVALYSGTAGLISGAQMMLDVAEELRGRGDMVILFVGGGELWGDLTTGVNSRALPNVLFVPFQPRTLMSQVQSTADVGLVTLGRGKGRTSVPSKVLAYMAAARPVIAAVDDDSDTAEWIREAECGWVVPAEDPHALADALLRAASDPAAASEAGLKGRRFLEQRLSRHRCTAAYERLLRGV